MSSNNITIHIYLDDPEETPVCSLYDMQSNPFALEELINLEPVHKQGNLPTKIANEENIRLYSKFRATCLKLVREKKTIVFDGFNTPSLTILYFGYIHSFEL